MFPEVIMFTLMVNNMANTQSYLLTLKQTSLIFSQVLNSEGSIQEWWINWGWKIHIQGAIFTHMWCLSVPQHFFPVSQLPFLTLFHHMVSDLSEPFYDAWTFHSMVVPGQSLGLKRQEANDSRLHKDYACTLHIFSSYVFYWSKQTQSILDSRGQINKFYFLMGIWQEKSRCG